MTPVPSPVVLCNVSYLPHRGGIEIWMSQVAARLVGRLAVFVVVVGGEALPRAETIDGVRVIRAGAPPRALPDRLRPYYGGRAAVRAVRRIADASGPVVFDFFDPRPEHVIAARALRRRGARAIVCSLGGTVSERAPARLKQAAAHNADAVVAISAYALRAFGEPHRNAHVFPPVGGAPPDFAGRVADFSSKQVLAVCRVHPRKNLEVLVDLAARFPCLSFVVAGDTEMHHAYHATLVRRAAAAGARNLRFVGNKVGEPLERLYRESTVFLLPSHHEMFGLVFAEAASFGLPVIAPRATAIPEAVGEGGVLYPPGDFDACAGMLDELTRSEERWRAVSAAAKEGARRRFALDWVGGYANFLAEAAGAE